jgi:hypothetical protein
MSNEHKINLEITAEDIPWMIHALVLQNNRALLSGQREGLVGQRIKAKLDQVRSFIPVLASWDIDEYAFCFAVMALRECKRWNIYQRNKPYTYKHRDGTFHSYTRGKTWDNIVLTVDDNSYNITKGIEYNEKLLNDLKEFFATIVAIDAEYYEQPEKA